MSFILFTLLLFIPAFKLSCNPQNVIRIRRSTEDSFVNVMDSQSKVCHRCRKLLEYFLPTTETPNTEFINAESSTTSGEAISFDTNVSEEHQNPYLISSSPKEVWNNFDATNSNERSGKESSTSESKEIRDSKIKSSVASSFPQQVEMEDAIRPVKQEKSSTDGDTIFVAGSLPLKGETEDGLHVGNVNERSSSESGKTILVTESLPQNSETEDGSPFLKLDRKSSSAGYSGDTIAVTKSLPRKGETKDESSLMKSDRRSSSFTNNFEISKSTEYFYPREIKIEFGPNKMKSYSNAEGSEMNHVLLGEINTKDNDEKNTNLFGNSKTNYGNGIQQAMDSTEKIAGIIADRGKSNRNDYNTFAISFSTTESLLEPSLRNGQLQENNEILDLDSSVRMSPASRKYLNFPVKIQAKVKEPRPVNDEWDVEEETPYFRTLNRGIKSSEEKIEVSKSASESPHVVTNVNGVVLEDSPKKTQSNKTLKLLEDSKPECDRGSGSCMECREISPNCHYNFRGKLCFYADVVHGNLIYECGIRFFTADGYQSFWTALMVIIVVSIVVLVFLVRAFYKRILQKDPITDMEVNDMRNIVHLIREKRGM